MSQKKLQDLSLKKLKFRATVVRSTTTVLEVMILLLFITAIYFDMSSLNITSMGLLPIVLLNFFNLRKIKEEIQRRRGVSAPASTTIRNI